MAWKRCPQSQKTTGGAPRDSPSPHHSHTCVHTAPPHTLKHTHSHTPEYKRHNLFNTHIRSSRTHHLCTPEHPSTSHLPSPPTAHSHLLNTHPHPPHTSSLIHILTPTAHLPGEMSSAATQQRRSCELPGQPVLGGEKKGGSLGALLWCHKSSQGSSRQS